MERGSSPKHIIAWVWDAAAVLSIHEQSMNHISLNKKVGLDFIQIRPLHRKRFGHYQASSAALGD